MIWPVKIALGVFVAYAAVAAIMALAQTSFLFPVSLASGNGATLPRGAHRLIIEVSPGVRLQGVHIPASAAGARTMLLGFGGNAWNAEVLAGLLARLFPAEDIVVFHYRGYPPSDGKPSAQAILQDATTIYDHVVAELAPASIVGVGVSIGGGPAMHLARHRKLGGVVLVTPFDSLHRLVGEHYWWLPVGLLLRHRMEVAADADHVDVPAAIIAAGRDEIIPPSRTQELRGSIKSLVFDRTVPNAGHNTLYDDEEFPDALRDAVAAIKMRITR